MRSKAALAAVIAATLLLSPAAWGQAATEPTPSPSETESPTPAPEVEEPQPPVEQAPSEAPDAEEVDPDPDGASSDDAAETSREDDRSEGSLQTQATPKNIFFHASPRSVPVGRNVRVWGRAFPDGGERWIKIVNPKTGYQIRVLRTASDGTFEGFVPVRKNKVVQARWKTVRSDRRHLRATPVLNVDLGETRLFGRARVGGRISRITRGKWLRLKLRRMDTRKVVEKRTLRIGSSGRFKTRFRIKKPGQYRAEAAFKNDNWRNVFDKSRGRSTPLPSLSVGSYSAYVKLLEKRLVQLRHHLTGRNWRFGEDTADAIMAFNKVNGRARVRHVDASTWWALAAKRRPQPRFDSPHFHIEVDQSKQVLYVVRGGKVRGILHVSTGASGTPTYDGTYQFWGKVAGYSPKRLYYPSYFHGGRAIHGWPEVPPYNASHGCVRVPMWAAKWIYAKTEVGDTIRVYH